MDSCIFMQIRLFRRNLIVNQHHTFLWAFKFFGKNAHLNLMHFKLITLPGYLDGQI